MESYATSSMIFDSPMGKLFAAANDKGIVELRFVDPKFQPKMATKSSPILTRLQRELTRYFAGKCDSFSVPLDLHGTPFQKRVWHGLMKIPHGQTVSYQRLATMIGSPKSARAVGQANGRNPVPIIVPCHRIIAANGGLGGYSSGLQRKSRLLQLEGSSVPRT